nr:tetratricopeptide repeat protein 4-like [Lytechinus pictus]
MAERQGKAEAKKLAEKLDKDIDDFIETLPKSRYKDGFSEDNWEEEFDKIPLFMKEAPENIEDCPELQAFQQIKYASEESTKEDNALTHKNDGNQWFKKKMYKPAVTAYTEGLDQKCADKEINAVLYTNRAAAHYHLGNHRSSLNDAKEALNLKPDHLKALNRTIDCCMQLKEYGEAIQWCDKALQIYSSDKKIQDLRIQASKLKKSADKEKRKKQLEEKKQRAAEEKLIAALKVRNLRFVSDPVEGQDGEPEEQAKAFVTSLVSNEPSGRHMVSLDDEGVLQWPVRFLYPEHGHSDLISAFNEDTRFIDHLVVMFSSKEAPPEWDQERKYQVTNLKVYFEDYDERKLVELNADLTLKAGLQHPRYHIVGGVPTFFVLSTATPYHEQFLKKY